MLSETIVYSLNARTKLANDTLSNSHHRQYRGLLDVYVSTLKTDGDAGLYRTLSSLAGLSPQIVMLSPIHWTHSRGGS